MQKIFTLTKHLQEQTKAPKTRQNGKDETADF
jgi:hypothetical protein